MASIKLKGDTSGEVTISAPAVAGTTTLTLPATSSTLATQNALGVRNLIINGDMRIAQRGTSSSGLTTSGIYLVDRFCNGGSNHGTWTHSQDTDVPTGQGFTTSLKYACTTANASLSASNSLSFFQNIEAQNLQHLKWGTANAESLTVSFWIKSNKTGTYTNEFYAQDGTRNISTEFTIDTADTWEKKTITVAGDTSGTINNDNGAGLGWIIWLGAGTNFTSGTLQTSWGSATLANRVSSSNVNLADSTSNYINITGVQLEVGDTATPFEHRPYDMELARCQRYYEKSGANQTVAMASGSRFPAYFAVTKRATPTMVYTFAVGTNNTSIESPTVSGFRLYTTGSTGAPCEFTWTASSEL